MDAKTWALRWIEGSIISYVRGRTSLNIVIGRIKRALNSYGVKVDEVMALIDSIENSNAYLPTMSRDEKIARLKPIRDVLNELCHRSTNL